MGNMSSMSIIVTLTSRGGTCKIEHEVNSRQHKNNQSNGIIFNMTRLTKSSLSERFAACSLQDAKH